MQQRNHEYERLVLIVTALRPGDRTYKHRGEKGGNKSLTRGRGVGDAMKLQTSELARRRMRGKIHIMYKCKDRREGSADLQSKRGVFWWQWEGDRMQIWRKYCTIEPS